MLVAAKNSTTCLENPEVHLHPQAQCKIAEALVSCAKSGRQVAAETHCDLIVRRVLRAMLEDELPQSRLTVYFTSLQHSGARLAQMEFDEQGRVVNWPDGFMTDDLELDSEHSPPPSDLATPLARPVSCRSAVSISNR